LNWIDLYFTLIKSLKHAQVNRECEMRHKDPKALTYDVSLQMYRFIYDR